MTHPEDPRAPREDQGTEPLEATDESRVERSETPADEAATATDMEAERETEIEAAAGTEVEAEAEAETEAEPEAETEPTIEAEPEVDDDTEALRAADQAVDREVTRLTRRGFVTMAVAAAAGYAGWRWVDSRPTVGRLPWPLREGHELNRALWERYYDPSRLVPTYPASRVQKPPVNGRYGLREEIDVDAWRLRVAGMAGGATTVLTLPEVMSLPTVDLITELRCIEGWSRIVHWTGVRFADFLAAYPPPTRDGSPPDPHGRPERLIPYVALETPGRGYYVGLDMASALHPQTLLAWALNGEPLTQGHGAPLRLVTPIKYGIKSLKRIGTIRYARERPADFWAERGYDWYSGH